MKENKDEDIEYKIRMQLAFSRPLYKDNTALNEDKTGMIHIYNPNLDSWELIVE